MAKGQTTAATNSSANLLNQAQGLAGPGSSIMSGFQNSLGGAQSTQGSEQSAAQAGIGNAQTTGGYDPSTLASLTSETAGNAQTGGYDPGQLSALQGQLGSTASGYSSLASTGGFTPAQGQAYVRQATEGTTGTYGVLENQVQQNKAKTGGLGTGGEMSQMARQLGQAQATNTLNAENSLSQMKTANTLSGLSGENATSGLESGLQSAVAGNKLAGTNQQLSLAGSQAAGVTAANSQMSQLYNTTTNQVTALGQQVLSTLGLDFSTQEAATNSLTTLSKNPGLLQTVLGDISGLGGAAAGAAGDLGVGV